MQEILSINFNFLKPCYKGESPELKWLSFSHCHPFMVDLVTAFIIIIISNTIIITIISGIIFSCIVVILTTSSIITLSLIDDQTSCYTFKRMSK